jgi:hypothetical protein
MSINQENQFSSSTFYIGANGGIGISDNSNENIRNMIISILMTSPGERVNMPDFGCGLKEMVFSSNGPLQKSLVDFVVVSALEKWIGDLITTNNVDVTTIDEKIVIHIEYQIKNNLQKERISVQI